MAERPGEADQAAPSSTSLADAEARLATHVAKLSQAWPNLVAGARVGAGSRDEVALRVQAQEAVHAVHELRDLVSEIKLSIVMNDEAGAREVEAERRRVGAVVAEKRQELARLRSDIEVLRGDST